MNKFNSNLFLLCSYSFILFCQPSYRLHWIVYCFFTYFAYGFRPTYWFWKWRRSLNLVTKSHSLQENSSIATEKLRRPFSLIICYDYCNIFAIMNICYSSIANLLQNNNYNKRCIFLLLNCNLLQHKQISCKFCKKHSTFWIIANLQKENI